MRQLQAYHSEVRSALDDQLPAAGELLPPVGVGRPMFGQRVLDVLGAIGAVRERPEAPGGVVLIGDHAAGLWALHAGALDDGAAAVAARKCLASYQHVVRSACPAWIQHDRMSGVVVGGVLKWFDLPELASLIAPRPLRLSGLVDGDGRAVPPDEMGSLYSPTARRYDALDARTEFLLADSDDLLDWDVWRTG